MDLRRSLSILTASEADIKLIQANSYEELVRNPPACHQRQLILLDPPYDSAGTYFTWNIYILWRLYRDRPKATLALWFPHYSEEQTDILLHRVQQLDLGQVSAKNTELLFQNGRTKRAFEPCRYLWP